MSDTSWGTVRAAALSAFAAATLCTLAAGQIGAAAQLPVTAAPIQFWDMEAHIDLPELPTVDLSACGPLEQYDEVVYGTDGPDTLVHGNQRQVLVGLGGDDRLEAGNHDDCLIGGAGDDTLLGGNGKDILIGEEGADLLDGGNGPDDIRGDSADTCVESGRPDDVQGCPPATGALELTDGGSPTETSVAPQTPSDERLDDERPTDRPGKEPSRSPASGSSRPTTPDTATPQVPTDPPALAPEPAAADVAVDPHEVTLG
jgi:hypothetical protein